MMDILRDILVPNYSWELDRPGTQDLTTTSLLNSSVLLEVGVRAGPAAQATERMYAPCTNARVWMGMHPIGKHMDVGCRG